MGITLGAFLKPQQANLLACFPHCPMNTKRLAIKLYILTSKTLVELDHAADKFTFCNYLKILVGEYTEDFSTLIGHGICMHYEGVDSA